ncbi:hypothetical protein NESM_000877700 [Novymonas esmeraldas]|uniref:Uncharacterized protein n=1 Tax=Novymonas esmeraldas TaxID=1808958 RepID=A0AAW0EZY1_9TRYP
MDGVSSVTPPLSRAPGADLCSQRDINTSYTFRVSSTGRLCKETAQVDTVCNGTCRIVVTCVIAATVVAISILVTTGCCIVRRRRALTCVKVRRSETSRGRAGAAAAGATTATHASSAVKQKEEAAERATAVPSAAHGDGPSALLSALQQ